MPRRRKRDEDASIDEAPLAASGRLDVNAIVSYNIKAIRERHGWTQQSVAERLGRLTGHELPQASISAMERGFDGDRKRRFDAHELYLLSMVFDVPIAYFFIPPPGTGFGLLADTGRPVTELYANLLGQEHQLATVRRALGGDQHQQPRRNRRCARCDLRRRERDPELARELPYVAAQAALADGGGVRRPTR